jgi:hypothetical protein
MINRTEDEINFLKRHHINIENLKTRWAWTSEDLAIKFYQEVIFPHYNRVTSENEIKRMGYRGFIAAVKRLGYPMNIFVKKSGYQPIIGKYVNMTYDDLKEFYMKEIYPKLKIKLKLSGNQPPMRKQVEANGYRGFTEALYRANKTFNEFLKDVGFKPFRDYKYKVLMKILNIIGALFFLKKILNL